MKEFCKTFGVTSFGKYAIYENEWDSGKVDYVVFKQESVPQNLRGLVDSNWVKNTGVRHDTYEDALKEIKEAKKNDKRNQKLHD